MCPGVLPCLLSYANQPDHALLDRFAVRDLLLALSQGTTTTEQRRSLAVTPVASGVGQRSSAPRGYTDEVVDYLRASGRRTPDAVRARLADVDLIADLYYELATALVCVFCDDARPALEILAQRDDLADAGYRVIALDRELPLEDQLGRFDDVFRR